MVQPGGSVDWTTLLRLSCVGSLSPLGDHRTAWPSYPSYETSISLYGAERKRGNEHKFVILTKV
jgi:hypothetical protein